MGIICRLGFHGVRKSAMPLSWARELNEVQAFCQNLNAQVESQALSILGHAKKKQTWSKAMHRLPCSSTPLPRAPDAILINGFFENRKP